MSYDFKTAVNRSDKYSIKWAQMHDHINGVKDDVVPFSVADTDFTYPPVLIDKFQDYVSDMIFGYSKPNEDYYNAFIKWVSNRHNYSYDREWIVDGNGVIGGIINSIRAFSNELDGIMIMSPVYPPFSKSIESNNRIVFDVPLINDNNEFTINYKFLEEVASNPSVKMLIMCSPHNPVGRVWTKEELTLVSDICERHNIIIISDEIHMDLLIDEHKHTVMFEASDYALHHSVILTSASKTFNLAGAQTSMAIIENNEMRAKFEAQLALDGIMGINAFGFKLYEIAYLNCGEYLDELLKVISDNHKLIKNFMVENELDVRVCNLEGTYLQWLDMRALNLSDEKLMDMLYSQELMFGSGIDYGVSGSGYVRMNIACPTHIVQSALERFKIAINTLDI